jgi:hypothetical protein
MFVGVSIESVEASRIMLSLAWLYRLKTSASPWRSICVTKWPDNLVCPPDSVAVVLLIAADDEPFISSTIMACEDNLPVCREPALGGLCLDLFVSVGVT